MSVSLLRLLQRNARSSAQDLARQLGDGRDAAAVEREIAELESAGVILGYQTVFDPERAGLQEAAVTALIEVKVAPERDGGFDRLAERIAGFDQVRGCYLVSGGYDLLVIVDGQSLREVAAFVSEKLSTLGGVLATATRFRLKVYKENGVSLRSPPTPDRLPVSP